MKNKAIIRSLKKNTITALIISGSLAPILISAISCLGGGIAGYDVVTFATVILSVMAILSSLAASLIAFILENRFSSAFFSVIWGLCAVCYTIFMIAQTTNLFEDAFFEYLMLIIAFPVWSYMPMLNGALEGISQTAPGIAAIVIAFLIMAFNIFSVVYISRKNREAEISNNG